MTRILCLFFAKSCLVPIYGSAADKSTLGKFEVLEENVQKPARPVRVFSHCGYGCTPVDLADIHPILRVVKFYADIEFVSDVSQSDVVLFFVGGANRTHKDEHVYEVAAKNKLRILPILLTEKNGFNSTEEYTKFFGVDIAKLERYNLHDPEAGPEFWSDVLRTILTGIYGVPQKGSLNPENFYLSMQALNNKALASVEGQGPCQLGLGHKPVLGEPQ